MLKSTNTLNTVFKNKDHFSNVKKLRQTWMQKKLPRKQTNLVLISCLPKGARCQERKRSRNVKNEKTKTHHRIRLWWEGASLAPSSARYWCIFVKTPPPSACLVLCSASRGRRVRTPFLRPALSAGQSSRTFPELLLEITVSITAAFFNLILFNLKRHFAQGH